MGFNRHVCFLTCHGTSCASTAHASGHGGGAGQTSCWRELTGSAERETPRPGGRERRGHSPLHGTLTTDLWPLSLYIYRNIFLSFTLKLSNAHVFGFNSSREQSRFWLPSFQQGFCFLLPFSRNSQPSSSPSTVKKVSCSSRSKHSRKYGSLPLTFPWVCGLFYRLRLVEIRVD